MLRATFLFFIAGIAEIGGGYLVWLWLRSDRSAWLGLAGSLVLVAYGVIPTLQQFPHFGRVYAAYGGVFVALSGLWGGASTGCGPTAGIPSAPWCAWRGWGSSSTDYGPRAAA